MRGLEKPAPPSNVSPDGQAPRGLVDAEAAYLAVLPSRTNKAKFAKATFDGLDKAKLREVLYGEQKSLCVYCERTISEGDPSPHVEHWRPRSRAPEHALHWRNLYLSCSTGDTCGVRKDHRPLKAGRRSGPSLAHRTRLRRVGRLHQPGRDVRPRRRTHGRGNPQCPRAGHRRRPAKGGRPRRAILNLNHPTLVAARRAAMDSEQMRWRRDLEQGTASSEERAARANGLLGRRQLPAFVSIRVSWLRRALGRGR